MSTQTTLAVYRRNPGGVIGYVKIHLLNSVREIQSLLGEII
jgi:hypothetical protein